MDREHNARDRSNHRSNDSFNGRHNHAGNLPANKPGQRFFKIGWKYRLKALIEKNKKNSADGTKPVSTKTQIERENTLFLCFKELHELGLKIQDPFNFQERHLRALVHKWEEEGLSAATIQNRISLVRVMSEWIGKGNMIKASETYCKNPESVKRVYAAEEDKSWTAKEVDIEAKIAEIKEYAVEAAAQLMLMQAFGLRAKEAICFKPNKHWHEDEGYITVRDGTKGGRERAVLIKTEIQIAALQNARVVAGPLKNASLGFKGKTLSQSYRRFFYVMEKFGVTKEQIGVTSHGLRHQFANDQYEALTGAASPVRGGQKGDVDYALDEDARYTVSESLGHSRKSITTAYYGTHRRSNSGSKSIKVND